MKVILTCFQQNDSFGPLTRDRPSALLPVFNVPLLQHHIEHAVSNGFKDIHIVAVDHPLAVRRFVGNGARWGAAISIWTFKDPCSGPETIARLADKLDGPVVLIPGEDLLNLSLQDLAAFHNSHTEKVTRVVCSSILEECLESDDQPAPIMSRTLLQPEESNIMMVSSPADAGAAAQTMVFGGSWVKVDSPRRLWVANMASLEGRFWLLTQELRARQQDGVWRGHHIFEDRSSDIQAPSMIGNFANLNADVEIGPYTMLGDSAIVDKGARVSRSLVFDHAYLGTLTNVENSVVAGNSILNLRIGSWVSVTDTFLVSSVQEKLLVPWTTQLFGKSIALAILVPTFPIWLVKGALRVLSGKPFFSKYRIIDWSVTDGTDTPNEQERIECLGFEGDGLVSRLPGLIDVLKGRLALVGVRPVRDSEELARSEEWAKQRFDAPAGLFTPVDAEALVEALEEEKLVVENLYAATRSFGLDVKILAKALKNLALGRV